MLKASILAGEQGPSCKSADQIPDLKVVHIRFIDACVGTGDSDEPADEDAIDEILLLAPAFKKKEETGFSNEEFISTKMSRSQASC